MANDIVCRHISLRADANNRCDLIGQAAGFHCSPHVLMCRECQKTAGAEAKVMEHPVLSGYAAQFLRARLVAGDCPRYQPPNPVDLTEAFGKLASLTDKPALADTISKMLSHGANLKEADGGHPAAVLAGKLHALAKAHDLEDALAEAYSGYLAANPIRKDVA